MSKSTHFSKRVGVVIFFFVFLLNFSPNLKAQYIHLSEPFTTFPNTTNPLPFNGWTQTLAAGDPSFDTWRFYKAADGCGRAVKSGSSTYAIFDSDCFSSAGGVEDVALVSPSIDTRGFSNVTLKWDHFLSPYFNCVVYVEVFNGTTWTAIWTGGTTSISWTTNTFNISSYCANIPNARVRFRFTGDFAFYWQIDNVQVSSTVSANDVATVASKLVGGQCGNSADQVNVTIRNTSSAAISNIPVKATINGTIGGNPVNTTLTGTYSSSLAAGAFATVSLGPLNTGQAGTLNVSSFTELGADPARANDTVKLNNYSIYGIPATLSPPNVTRCGAGTVGLNSGASSGNTAIWYSTSTAVAPLTAGNSFTTPLMVPPASTTYYVSQATTSPQRMQATNMSGTNFYGYGTPGGNMFNINAANNLIVDSIAVNIYSSGVPVDISVFYKVGTYVGSETNSAAWTLGSLTTVTAKGQGVPTYVKLARPMAIPAGQVYGIYIQASQELLFSAGSADIINSDFTLSTGIGVPLLFGGISPSYTWNGTLYYRIYCESNRVAVTAIANPAPQGSNFSPVTPFAGTYTSGMMSNPDIVATPDQVKYDILPPTGFLNSGFPATWKYNSIVVRSKNGTILPSTDYQLVDPSGSTNGYVLFKPSMSFVDSIIIIDLSIKRNDNGCDTVIERVVYNAPRPTTNFTFTSVCLGDVTDFENKSNTNPSALVSYIWDFGDGITSTLINPTKKYNASGSYNVKLIAITDLGYTDSISKTITVLQLPQPNFKFTNACDGAPISFADNSSLPSGTPTYTWDFGDGSPTAGGTSASRMYTSAGIYKVTLSIEINTCVNSISKYVTLAPRTAVNFNANLGQCDNRAITFTNKSTDPSFGKAIYKWYFGDGLTSIAANPEHTYSAFKTYNVTLLAITDLGCKDSIVQAISLKEAPLPAISTSGVCANQDVNFTNNTNIPPGSSNTYTWEFGDGDKSALTNPMHQYTRPGTFKVTLSVVSTNGCQGSKDFFVTVGDKPVAGFRADKVCLGNETQFLNSSYSNAGTIVYDWNIDGAPSSLENPVVQFATAGTKNVSLKVTVGACSDNITKTVEVAPNPKPDILYVSKHSGDGSVIFHTTDGTAGNQYAWEFGDGGGASVQDPSYTYSSLFKGYYKVRLTIINADGCRGSIDTVIVVNATGINGPASAAYGLKVYPNPSSGNVNIATAKDLDKDVTITVSDITGRTVKQLNNVKLAAGVALQLDLADLKAGTYSINIFNTDVNETVKISIVR